MVACLHAPSPTTADNKVAHRRQAHQFLAKLAHHGRTHRKCLCHVIDLDIYFPFWCFPARLYLGTHQSTHLSRFASVRKSLDTLRARKKFKQEEMIERRLFFGPCIPTWQEFEALIAHLLTVYYSNYIRRTAKQVSILTSLIGKPAVSAASWMLS